MAGTSETGDTFGAAVRVLNTNKDGHVDLLIGAPGENGGAGSLWLLRGSATSVTATGSVNVGPGGAGLSSSGSAHFAQVVTGP
ncbi:FG-GAP repeat protein [Streptomyces sp. NPDC059852]|uniref:FG-GAP repeat protein n=1 Tax=Streptomyces sp. NPDC059852 TaxID=3346972 RepID=UPI0036681CBD